MGRFLVPALLAVSVCACASTASASLTLTAPVEYQVVQRSSRSTGGVVQIRGRLTEVSSANVEIQARLYAPEEPAEWKRLPARVTPDSVTASLDAPGGGWRRLEVRAMDGESVVGEAVVEHLGIGEVFVVAGQSNSANHGEEKQKPTTGRVSTFDGTNWRLADDPQPGASGEGGSFLPPFGDAMVKRFNVPVGVVSCGVGATSVREWLPGGSRFPHPPTLEGNVQPALGGGWESTGKISGSFIGRLNSLGFRGFRAVLWHQGESDANQQDPVRTLPGLLYRESLEKVIVESRRVIGWEAPWFVAQASYHVPGDEASPDIRAAQASLWKDGLALEGPDSDALKGEMREAGGQGVHFSGPGLRAHAALWAEKVGPWLERELSAASSAPKKVLFLGNSITLHGPAPDIGWTGQWGMAASSEEKDYVHLLTSRLAAAGTRPEIRVKNIAEFERGYDAYDIPAQLQAELAFGADLVILAIGENVADPATDIARAGFSDACDRLLTALHRQGRSRLIVRSSFWPHPGKDQILQQAAARAGARFVDISALGGDEKNAARSEQKIDHAGVGAHPGDRGMQAIAEALYTAIQGRTDADWPDGLIGYSELSTDLPGGRHANVRTTRAFVVKADGTGRRELAPSLITSPDTSSQFAGWSPDGSEAIVYQAWKSAATAQWEEENKAFRFTPEGLCRLDACLVDLATGRIDNLTLGDCVSSYNSGVFFWPKDPTKLGFTALIDGASHPFRMDRDGRNKIDLTAGTKAFSYGFSSSPDGQRIAYHQDYQIVVADADGSNARRIDTGHPFNFGPVWSPDGEWLLFVSGEHSNCHPHLVRADGTRLRKLADRNGYRGVVEFLDVPDFHGGSSDTPVWAADGSRVFYTAQADNEVALFSVGLDGVCEQLTRAGPGSAVYHPQPTRDGGWLVYGARRNGVRQLIVMRLADRIEKQITQMTAGRAAMWPQWQPVDPGR